VKVPTLAACLEACRRLGLEVHLELKAAGNLPTRLTEKVLEALAAVGMTDTALISSFDHGLLARVRELGITVRTAVLTSERLYDPVAYLARLGAQAYCPGSDVALGPDTHEVDVETIRAVRRAGSEVYVWTVNDRARMRELIDAGVNGIYTDFPNRLRALVTR
jgi:glycerophosphoryl diester phosphodiesterase